MAKESRNDKRVARHQRIRKNVYGTPEKPRLCVFRSSKNISVQVIDDVNGVTLASASTVDKELKSQIAYGGNETIVSIRRVAKTVKGGRHMRFSVTVVVGDGDGHVGVGLGKAQEIPEAVRKATEDAKKNIITVPTVGTTIPHRNLGVFGAGRVLLMPAAQGTGVIAGSSVRTVLEAAGIKDIRAKSIGSNNTGNMAYATIEGLRNLTTVEEVARKRGKTKEEILG